MDGAGHGESRSVSVDHYENFPVASWLCPADLRAPIAAIYRFARTADDIADEGERRPRRASPSSRRSVPTCSPSRPGGAASPRWPEVFGPLAQAIVRHGLPVGLLADLLDAFSAGRARDPLRRPGRPARLLPPLRESDRPPAAPSLRHRRRARARPERCDLQRAAARQLLAGPRRRRCARSPLRAGGRRGAPRRRARRRARAARQRSAPRALVARARRLGARADARGCAPGRTRSAGAPAGSCASSSRAACASSSKIDRLGGATLSDRPTLGWRDAPVLAWRALTMRPRADRPLARSPRPEPSSPRTRHDARSNTSRTRPPQAARASTTRSCSSPPPRRAAITAFYAFCREVDDVADEVSDPGVAATKLAWWRSEVGVDLRRQAVAIR